MIGEKWGGVGVIIHVHASVYIIDHALPLSVSQTPTTSMLVESPILKKLCYAREYCL